MFEVCAASFPNVDCGAETALSRVSAESAYVSELPGIISPAFVGFVGEYIGVFMEKPKKIDCAFESRRTVQYEF